MVDTHAKAIQLYAIVSTTIFRGVVMYRSRVSKRGADKAGARPAYGQGLDDVIR